MIAKATDFFGIETVPTLSIWLDQEEFVKIEGLVDFIHLETFSRDFGFAL